MFEGRIDFSPTTTLYEFASAIMDLHDSCVDIVYSTLYDSEDLVCITTFQVTGDMNQSDLAQLAFVLNDATTKYIKESC